jgi:hypothetical protein
LTGVEGWVKKTFAAEQGRGKYVKKFSLDSGLKVFIISLAEFAL